MTQVDILNSIFSLNPTFKLQYEAAQQKHVLLYPEGMVTLNDGAIAILQKCNGKHSVENIVNALSDDFDVAPATIKSDVIDFIATAYDKQWLIQCQ